MSLLNKENKKDIIALDFEIALFFNPSGEWPKAKLLSMDISVKEFVKENIKDILGSEQFATKGLSDIYRRAGEWLNWNSLRVKYEVQYRNQIDIFLEQDARWTNKYILNICIIPSDDYTCQFLKMLVNN